MRRNRRNPHPAENHERWLITYSDLITLLLIFFILMYAMSKVDIAKYKILSQALQMEFKKSDTILQQNSGVVGTLDPQPQPDASQREIQKELQAKEQREKELQNLLQVIRQFIEEKHLQSEVSAADTERGIAITLNDLFLFDLGKADLKPAAYPVLDKLASLFPRLDAKVSIEGHTDDLPLASGSTFVDNWGLSNARSLSVLRYFVNTAGLDPKQFISTGYADTMPTVPNDSDAHRQQNRRVEIVVLR